MIRTGAEATKALKEIKRKTKWSIRKISRQLGISHTSVCSLHKGHTENPSQHFMDKISELREELAK